MPPSMRKLMKEEKFRRAVTEPSDAMVDEEKSEAAAEVQPAASGCGNLPTGFFDVAPPEEAVEEKGRKRRLEDDDAWIEVMKEDGYEVKEEIFVVDPDVEGSEAEGGGGQHEEPSDMEISMEVSNAPVDDSASASERVLFLEEDEELRDFEGSAELLDETALTSEIKYRDEIERVKLEKEMKVVERMKVELRPGEVPVGFFDDADRDAVARGMEAPSKRSERMMDSDLRKLAATARHEQRKEEFETHREVAQDRRVADLHDIIEVDQALRYRIDNVKERREKLKDVQDERAAIAAAEESSSEDEEEEVDWRAKGGRHT